MFRLFAAAAAVAVALDCTTVTAQRYGRCARGADISRGYYSGGYGRSSSIGLSIGFGGYPGYGLSSFGYGDPYPFYGYRSGHDPFGAPNFVQPDLLRDPYFRARHKFDSHFPGRYRTPLELRSNVPVSTYRPQGPVVAYPDPDPLPAPVGAEDLPDQLRAACDKLSMSLLTLNGGAPWQEYLAPHQISELVAQGDSDRLHELLSRYDSVLGNPQLRSLEAAPGFSITRILLRQYLSQTGKEAETPRGEPTVETLPLPEPTGDGR